MGILSYTALQSFAESGSGGLSDDVEWKADRTDVEALQREVEDLRDEIYHLRVGRERANKGVYEQEETTKDLQTGWQLQEESNDVMWEHLGQEAELRSLREAVEKLKEEMAFLKVAEDSAYERDVSDKKSQVPQKDGAQILPEGLDEASLGLIPLRRIQGQEANDKE